MVSELLNVPSVTVYFSSTIINSCISSFLNVISEQFDVPSLSLIYLYVFQSAGTSLSFNSL